MIPGIGFRPLPLGSTIDPDAFWDEDELSVFYDEEEDAYFIDEDE